MEHRLSAPFSADELKGLRAGDSVLLSGTVYAARDAAHRRMYELIQRGEPLPFDPRGKAIYYVGPSPARPGEVTGSAGPTTSGRMDAFAPALFRLGLLATIGKGARSAAVKEAMAEAGAVYFVSIGGAAALTASRIKKAEVVAWPELGTEALRRLTVEDMPLTVAIDTQGGDIYELGPAAYLASLKK